MWGGESDSRSVKTDDPQIVGCGHDPSILGNLTARARRSVKPQDRAAGCDSELGKTKFPTLSHNNGPLDARRCEVIHV